MPAVEDLTEEEKRREALLGQLLAPWEQSRDAAALAQLQAQDAPGVRTIAVSDPGSQFSNYDLEQLRKRDPSAASQFDAEVARAQRNNGFINSEVNIEGQVLQPAVDPGYVPPILAAQLEAQARHIRGQRMYDSLVKGGAKPEEALRLSAGDLFYTDPRGLTSAIRATSPRPVIPTSVSAVPVRDAEGKTIAQGIIGPSGGVQIVRPPITKAAKAEVPLDVVAGQKNIAGEITDLRRDLERAKIDVEKDPGNTDAARRAVNYQNRLTELQQRFQEGSTNWMRPSVSEKAQPKALSIDQAKEFLKAAGGDKAKARKMALDAGYSL